MNEPSPEQINKIQPLPAEVRPPTPETKIEGEVSSPEIEVGPEISNEQLDQQIAQVESQIEQQRVEFIPEAETQIDASTQDMNVSPEMLNEAKQEQNLDSQLQEIQTEVDQAATETKSEIETVKTGTAEKPSIEKSDSQIKEKTKIYENPADDLDIQEVEKEILRITNQDVKQFQEGLWGEAKKKEAASPGGYSETWDKMNALATMRQWEAFVRRYPEKAEAYKDKLEPIKKALDWEKGRSKREKRFQEMETGRFKKETITSDSNKAENFQEKPKTPEENYADSRMESRRLMSRYYELSDEQDKIADAMIANPDDAGARAKFWEITNEMEEIQKKREEAFGEQQKLVGELLEMDYKNDTRLFKQAEAKFRDKLAGELVKGNPDFQKYLEMLEEEGFLEKRETAKKEVVDLINDFDSIDEQLFRLQEAAERGEEVDEAEIKELEEQRDQLENQIQEWIEENGRENFPEGIPIDGEGNFREAKGTEREKEEKKILEIMEQGEQKESLESRRNWVEQWKKDAVKDFEQAIHKDWKTKDAVNLETTIKIMKMKVPGAMENKLKDYLTGKVDEPPISVVWIRWQTPSFFERWDSQPNRIKNLEITFDNKTEKLATEEELKPKPKKGQVGPQPNTQPQQQKT